MRSQQSTTPATAALVIAAAVTLGVLLSAACYPGFGTISPETPQRLTVTITQNGVTPATVKPPICRSSFCVVYVTFVNRDSVPHDMRSDPHPTHTQCLYINQLGAIAPDQSKEASLLGCSLPLSYHDDTRPDDQRFWGRIEGQ